jgi:DNA-directed RNA polymerase specialized sigma24 family protein
MPTGITEAGFTRLLACLHADRDRAGERYEALRLTLLRYFEWRGVTFPEERCDETFDRVARRLAEGLDVKNIGGYCYEVARLLALETRKGPETRRVPLDSAPPATAATPAADPLAHERRLQCLDQCLGTLPLDSQRLIVEYYRSDKRERIDARKELARQLGVRLEALANRAQRLRDKLESCVSACLSAPRTT